MRRRIETLVPFEFASDFSPPARKTPDMLVLSPGDLAALLAETRESTARLVRDDTFGAQAERLAKVGEDLREAMLAISHLARHLELAAIDEHDKQTALASVRSIARTLLDGQGELFDRMNPRSRVGNDSGQVCASNAPEKT